ncbi:MAG TPA: exonuclease domain-containing protein [Streptosporangiaceae bacterium]
MITRSGTSAAAGRQARLTQQRIHGITTADVADAPSFADIADEVRAHLDVPALVAHNAHVDIAVLRHQMPKWDVPEVFDTLKLAKRLLPNQSGYRLGMLPKRSTWRLGCPTT